MKTIKGFANYGCLAHEKRIQFTISNPHGYAKVSDEIEIEIPDGWEMSENQFGEVLLSKDGITHKANKLIASENDSPVLSWHDGKKTHREVLKWREL